MLFVIVPVLFLISSVQLQQTIPQGSFQHSAFRDHFSIKQNSQSVQGGIPSSDDKVSNRHSETTSSGNVGRFHRMPNSTASFNLTEFVQRTAASHLSSSAKNSERQYPAGLKLPPIYYSGSQTNTGEQKLNLQNKSPLYQSNPGNYAPATNQNTQSRRPVVIEDTGGHVFKIPAFPDSAVRTESLKYSNVNNEELFRNLYATHPDIHGYVNPDKTGPLNVLGLPHKFRVPHPSGHANGFLPFVYASNSRLAGPAIDAGVARYSGYIDDEFRFRRLYDFHPHIHTYVNPEKNVPINVLGLPHQFRIPNPRGLVNGFRPPEVETNKYLPGPVVDQITNIPNLPIAPEGKTLLPYSPTPVRDRHNVIYPSTSGHRISYNNPNVQYQRQNVLTTGGTIKYKRDLSGRLGSFRSHHSFQQTNDNSKLKDNYASKQPHYMNINYHNTAIISELRKATIPRKYDDKNNNNTEQVVPYAKYSQGPIRYASRNIKYYSTPSMSYQTLTTLHNQEHNTNHQSKMYHLSDGSVNRLSNRVSAVRFPDNHEHQQVNGYRMMGDKNLDHTHSLRLEIKSHNPMDHTEIYDYISYQNPQARREKQQQLNQGSNSQHSSRVNIFENLRPQMPKSNVRFPDETPFAKFKAEISSDKKKVNTLTNNNNNSSKLNPPAYRFSLSSSTTPGRPRLIYKRPPLDHSKIKSKIPRLDPHGPLGTYDKESQYYNQRIRFPSISSNETMKYDGVTNPIRNGRRRFLLNSPRRFNSYYVHEGPFQGTHEDVTSYRYSPSSEYATYHQAPSYQNERYYHYSKEYDGLTKYNAYQDNKDTVKNRNHIGDYQLGHSQNYHYDNRAHIKCQGRYIYQDIGNAYDSGPYGYGQYHSGFQHESNYGRAPPIGPYAPGASYGSPNNYGNEGYHSPNNFYNGQYDHRNNYYHPKPPQYPPRPYYNSNSRPKSLLQIIFRRIIPRIIRLGLRLGITKEISLDSPYSGQGNSYNNYRRTYEEDEPPSPPNASLQFQLNIRNLLRGVLGL